MRLIFTLVFWVLFIVKANSCPILSTSQTFYITDAKTKLPISNVSIKVFYDDEISRLLKTDSLGMAKCWLYCDDKIKLILKHDSYPVFETKITFSKDYSIGISIVLSKKGKGNVYVTKLDSIRKFRGCQLTIIKREHSTKISNQISNQISDDHCFHDFACRMEHADRSYEQKILGGSKLFNKILVYPNPVTSGVDVCIESKYGDKKRLLLTDMSGNILMDEWIVFHFKIQTSRLSAGMYVIKIIDEKADDVTVAKLIVN
ncbi:MAG: T9SS type A sorting domain-containing protein [Bacteroidia bacterium]|jgi:hypothetical protein|nr:T9SS type A sorting domain-containing protein [Bacteroidia bacterium]